MHKWCTGIVTGISADIIEFLEVETGTEFTVQRMPGDGSDALAVGDKFTLWAVSDDPAGVN